MQLVCGAESRFAWSDGTSVLGSAHVDVTPVSVGSVGQIIGREVTRSHPLQAFWAVVRQMGFPSIGARTWRVRRRDGNRRHPEVMARRWRWWDQ
jgi:hypothetical protein